MSKLTFSMSVPFPLPNKTKTFAHPHTRGPSPLPKNSSNLHPLPFNQPLNSLQKVFLFFSVFNIIFLQTRENKLDGGPDGNGVAVGVLNFLSIDSK